MFFPSTAESRISVKSTDNCGLSTFVRRFRPIYVRCELAIMGGVVERRAGGAGRVGGANIANMDSDSISITTNECNVRGSSLLTSDDSKSNKKGRGYCYDAATCQT